MKKLIIITGATASGKSDFAINIAKSLDSEIISCDSMQIYKDFDIGTAKASTIEMQGIQHHMIDIVKPTDNYSVGEYVSEVEKIFENLYAQNKIPILCGGTGLYVEGVIYSFSFGNVSDEGLRKSLELELEEKGAEYMYSKLYEIDKDDALKMHPNNTKRVIRALELYYLKGENKSQLKEKSLKYDVYLCNLNPPRQELYNRINLRVERMVERGLLEEVKGLLNQGVTFDNQSMKAIGYKEFKEYFEEQVPIDDVIEKIKQNSRHYAKRQVTWFKRYDFAHNFNSYDENELALAKKEILEFAEN